MFGTQTSAIGVATSETLKPGSWTDHGQATRSGADAKIVPYNIMNAIDMAIFINPADGTAYLNYGGFLAIYGN
jgi:arabinan endo-1,5-alpha-L-arabinosidase